MNTDRLKAYGPAVALDHGEARLAELSQQRDRFTEVTPGGPPCRPLWLRIGSGVPGNSPDERYYADEVRPKGLDLDGHIEWEAVPGGLSQVVVHNTAEAPDATHLLPEDMVIHAEERLDRSSPPEFVYLACVPVLPERLARIVSYDAGAYTVQPVRRGVGGFEDDGPAISGVANIGELWEDEAGYLSGPPDFDRYVRIVWTRAGWTIVLHPPRMV